MTEPPELVPPARELEPEMGSFKLFSGQASLVYMNHAGISPPSAVVRKAVANMLADYGKRGADAYPTWAAQRARLRGKLAALVGASPEQIALTHNTSRGIGDVALCFAWKPGDKVVVFDGEFPANVVPWLRAAELFSLEVVRLDGRRFVTDEGAALAALEGELAKGGVRMVAVSAVQFQTGYRAPVEAMSALCRARGARLFVDAVQACGMTSIDVRRDGIDYLSAGSHKWMMGIEGAGFVYAGDEAARDLVPRTISWLSFDGAIDFLFEGPGKLRYDKPVKSGIQFLEGANLSAASFVALEAALDLLQKLGVERIFEHVQKIHDALEPGAVDLGMVSVRAQGASGRSGSLCLLPPADVPITALHREMTSQGIACAMPDGYLRLSPHWWLAVDEADQVLLALRTSLANVRSSGSRSA
ncbi:MAG: aminotransferase class V-fold PLP-dependent enzyme [Myxococcales bacterium]|nr:aminotransferase class V-fold PLP-dependent enzyme [Myxococcales bacterium]